MRPLRVPPDEPALREVELPLVDGRAGDAGHVRGRTDVVRVEVRDEDAGYLGAEAVERARPALLRVRQADARVDERVAVRAREEVRVHVARPRRQRARDAADAAGKLERLLHHSIESPFNSRAERVNRTTVSDSSL